MRITDAQVLESIRQERANVEWISQTVYSLRKRYGGRYIAVKDRQVIGHDRNFGRLLHRVRGLEGVTVEFITDIEYLWVF